MEQKSPFASSAYHILNLSVLLRSTNHEMIPAKWSAYLAPMQGTADYRGDYWTTALLMFGGTDSSATAHRLKTSSTSSVVYWASELCECTRVG